MGIFILWFEYPSYSATNFNGIATNVVPQLREERLRIGASAVVIQVAFAKQGIQTMTGRFAHNESPAMTENSPRPMRLAHSP